MYKTVVIEYSPKADIMAKKVEEKSNEMLEAGYELVTMSITNSAKAILVFKKILKKEMKLRYFMRKLKTGLIFKKEKHAKVFSKINIISFFIYYFGFLVYWDFIAITSKDYILAVFSLLAWAGGIFVAYKKYLRFRDINWLKNSKMEMR